MADGRVFVPPRGLAFHKFSFDFPEPAIAFEGFSCLSGVDCGHLGTAGKLMARLGARDGTILCDVDAELDQRQGGYPR